MDVSRSRTGLPVLAEAGGGATNTGSAVIIAGPTGERLKPLFIPRGYAQGEHALFVVEVGMLVLQASRSRAGETVTVSRIDGIGTPVDPDEVVLREVAGYENGDGDIPEGMQAAVAAALEKTGCYHCRHSHYVWEADPQ